MIGAGIVQQAFGLSSGLSSRTALDRGRTRPHRRVDHDEAIRQEHDRFMAASVPHARLVILPDTSHFAMLQQAPTAFGAVVLRAIGGEDEASP